MASINLIYCGTHNCGIYRSAINFASLTRSLGHDVTTYPAEGLIKRPCTGTETGDLTVLMLPPILMDEAYAYAGVKFNPEVRHVGYWYWETDCVPDNWRTCCEEFQVKEVWAPNKFVFDACKKRKLTTPVEIVIPYVQPPKIIREPKVQITKGLYTFLYIFDFASCWERKNPHALLEAFNKAFTRSDKVQLIVKTVRGFLVPGVLEALRKEADKGLSITFIDGDMPFSEVHGLQKLADCYVSPHRGEGLGLTIIDAAYLGKPVIATEFGGNTSLGLTPLSIHFRKVPIPKDVPAYGGQGMWAEPDVRHLSKTMKWCYNNQKEAKVIGSKFKAKVEGIFNEKKLLAELEISLNRNLR